MDENILKNNSDNQKVRAFLVGVNLGNNPNFESELKELESLAEACNMEVVGVETQNLDQVNTGVYVGKGKADEIKAVSHMLEADVIIFDDNLSPMQLRNLKDIIERPVFDRTHLILQIFSSRARTREAQIQVETARLQYELPRLTGMGEVLSRQGGGSGGLSNKGAGEKKLELDKRKIRHRIFELKKELKEVEQNRQTQRKKRMQQGIPLVALVGYTNAGKSTLMNALLDQYGQNEDKKVLAQNMLFATLDTTVRKIHLPDNKEFLLSDTVGFINKLPHNLVQAFHSTLEEVKYADLLLEVVDCSDEHYMEHMTVTKDTLKKLEADDIPCIHVFNKCDQCPDLGISLPKKGNSTIHMAAGKGIGIPELTEMIAEEIFKDYVRCEMLIPYTEGNLISYFNENAAVYETEYLAEGTKLSLSCLFKDLQKYKQYVI